MRPHRAGVEAGFPVHAPHRRRVSFRSLIALGFLWMSVLQIAGAQTSPVRLSGGLNLGNELYSSSGIEARRPRSTYRAILTPTLTIFDQISLPFEFYLTSDDRGFRQPFNQFGVNPRLWGWLTLHAGYYSARISDLTFGDVRLFGGGVELTPGLFRFSFLYGRSQQAVQTDTTRNFRGVFEQKIYALKIGYGTANHFFVDLNFLHAEDDKGSLHNPVPGVSSDSVLSSFDVAPRENAVASLSYGIPILGAALQLTGETAVSALSNDTRLPELTGGKFKSTSLFTPRVSSQIDGASQLSLNAVPAQTLSVRLTGKWIGPGYVSLGYAQMPNDVMEFTVAPSYHTIDGMFSLRPSFGVQYNNLRNNRFSTTRRTIASISSTVQPSQSWGFDVLYSNYGMRSNPRNDTLRIDNIAQMVTVSPPVYLPLVGGNQHADGELHLSGFYGLQRRHRQYQREPHADRRSIVDARAAVATDSLDDVDVREGGHIVHQHDCAERQRDRRLPVPGEPPLHERHGRHKFGLHRFHGQAVHGPAQRVLQHDGLGGLHAFAFDEFL